MFKRLLLAATLLWAAPAWAQNPTCPERPLNDNSNACATTSYADRAANNPSGGSAITALTGDITATGPGSAAATLATVNSNIGSFGSSTAIPTVTVNAKGLITAVTTNVVIAPAGTLTGTTLASNVVTSSLTTVGTIGTGVWQGTNIALGFGGTNSSLTASVGGLVYSTASGLAILPGTVTAGQCALSGSNAPPTWGSCSGGAAVSSVSNSDGSLTITPTTGAVVGSINLSHTNTFTVAQNVNLNSAGLVAGTTPFVHYQSADGNQNTIQMDAFLNGGGNVAPYLLLRTAGGTGAAPSATPTSKEIGVIVARGYGTTGYSTNDNGSVQFNSCENWTDTSQCTNIILHVTPIGTVISNTALTLDPSTTGQLHAVFGGNTGGNSLTGSLWLEGSTSGVIEITPQNTAGTYTLTLGSGGANSTLTFGGNLTTANTFATSGNFPLTLTTTASTNVTLPVSGTLLVAPVANASLANSSLTYGTTTVALGSSSTSIGGLTGVGLTSGSTINWNSDTFIGRAGAANVMLGAADAASPVAQTLSVQNVVAGTANTAGANLTFVGSKGTGTSAGGSIAFQIGTPGSSGSTQNTLATVMTVGNTGAATSGVGIGCTTNSGVVLTICGNAGFGQMLFRYDTSGAGMLVVQTSSGGPMIFNLQANSTLDFNTNNSTVGSGNGFRVQAGGALSVGTTIDGGNGTLLANTHLLAGTGTTPTISSCGTGSPTVSTGSGDNFGGVVAGGGVLTSCVINFGKTWGAAPRCVASSGTAIASLTVTASTTQLTIGGTSLTGDTINWVCGSTAANDNIPESATRRYA